MDKLPVCDELSKFLSTAKEMKISNQAKSALSDPQLARDFLSALQELRDKPGTGTVHKLKDSGLGRDVFGFDFGKKGTRGVFMKNADGTFSLLGLSKDHDYKQMLGIKEVTKSFGLPEIHPHMSQVEIARARKKARVGKGGIASTLVGGAITLASTGSFGVALDDMLPTNVMGQKSISCQFAQAVNTVVQVALPVGGAAIGGPVGLAGGLVLSELSGRIGDGLVNNICNPSLN